MINMKKRNTRKILNQKENRKKANMTKILSIKKFIKKRSIMKILSQKKKIKKKKKKYQENPEPKREHEKTNTRKLLN